MRKPTINATMDFATREQVERVRALIAAKEGRIVQVRQVVAEAVAAYEAKLAARES